MGSHPKILSHVTQVLGLTSPSQSWVSLSHSYLRRRLPQAVSGVQLVKGGFFPSAVTLWLA